MINPPTVLLHKCKGNKFQRNAGLLFIVGEVSAKFLPKFRNTMVLIFALLCETLESKELRTNYGLQSKCVLTSGRNFARCYFGIFARPRNKVFQAVLHTTARGEEILKWDLPAKRDRKFSGRERHCYLPRVTFWWATEQVIFIVYTLFLPPYEPPNATTGLSLAPGIVSFNTNIKIQYEG